MTYVDLCKVGTFSTDATFKVFFGKDSGYFFVERYSGGK